jgi:hypothetical protein
MVEFDNVRLLPTAVMLERTVKATVACKLARSSSLLFTAT